MIKKLAQPKVWVFFGLAMLMAFPLWASLLPLGSPYKDPGWQVVQNPLLCRLGYAMPQYGTLAFVQEAGKDTCFELQPLLLAQVLAPVSVYGANAPWKPNLPLIDIGVMTLEVSLDKTFYRLPHEPTLRLLSAIMKGQFGLIRHPLPGGAMASVNVSPLHFQKKYQDFLACLKQLLPFTVESIRNFTVYFSTKSNHIELENQQQLNRLAELSKSGIKFDRIVLKGYTDDVGSIDDNLRLSAERTTAVKRYLMAAGVPDKKIESIAMGEVDPIADNNTEEGRKKNRRVMVELWLF